MLTSVEFPHYQNFVDALRAGDPKILTCEIMEGHLSSTLPHLANIAYLTKRSLTFDGKSETFVNDKDADKLLTREYRKGFEISDKLGTNNELTMRIAGCWILVSGLNRSRANQQSVPTPTTRPGERARLPRG